MKYNILLVIFFLSIAKTMAQKKKDIEAIKGQCGCFDITFKYAETFAPDTNYQFHERYLAYATEYVFVIEESKDKIVLQHLLAIRGANMVVKHWREDWTFRDSHLLSYYDTNDFRYSNISKGNFKNAWTQTVYGTQDEPRYSGFSEWAHVNGKSVWEARSDAALPRREYAHRSDYNVMSRGNRIHVTKSGYLHEQDNDKIIRIEGQTDVLLASEKGYNDYIHTDMEKCQITKDWWEKNKDFWVDVRASWREVENAHESFTISSKVDDQRITSFIHDLQEENLSPVENRKRMDTIISDFIEFNY